MAESKSMDLKECTIIFSDGTGTPNTLELKIDEGNLTWSEKRNITAKKDRGVLDYMKENEQEACEVNLECRFSSLKASSGDPVTPYEFLKLSGAASGYKSTGPLCSASALDLIVKVNHVCGTTIEDEIITFADFTYTDIGGDFKAGTLSVKGMCLIIGPTSVRTVLV